MQQSDLVILPHNYYNFEPYDGNAFRYGAYLSGVTQGKCILFFVFGYKDMIELFPDFFFDINPTIEIVEELIEEIVFEPYPELWNSDSGDMVFFRSGGWLSITHNFTGTPVWTDIDLFPASADFIVQAEPDYNCDLLAGTGTQVDCLFIGGTVAANPDKAWFLADVDGSRTLTKVYDLNTNPITSAYTGATLNDREIMFIKSFEDGSGYLMIARATDNTQGYAINILYSSTSSDGLTWTPFTAFVRDTAPSSSTAIAPEVCAYRNGTVYADFEVKTAGVDEYVKGIHTSIDGGNSWSTGVVQSTNGSTCQMLVIDPNETDFYQTFGSPDLKLRKNGTDITITNVVAQLPTPNVAFQIDEVNPLVMAYVGVSQADANERGWRSVDGGANFTLMGVTNYRGCLIARDDTEYTLWYGANCGVSVGFAGVGNKGFSGGVGNAVFGMRLS